ncbi:amino acid permease [Penicillium tannophilum]|nr:amino acid permease [Penicillium tannophilum]
MEGSTSEAMEGNAYDLVRNLHWLSPLFDEEQAMETRVVAAKLQRGLCCSFLHVESMHRDAHKIAGRRLFRNQAGAEDYKKLVAERQPALAPIPDESTSPDLQTRFFVDNMLRLWMGDVGYFEWRNALRIFNDGRKKLLRGRNLHFLASSYLYIAIFASFHFIYKIWYRTKRTLLDESPLLPHVEIAKKDPDLPEKPKSKWSKNNILCSQLSAAIPVGNTPPVGLWTLPHQELRKSCNTIIIKAKKDLSSDSSRKSDELKPAQQRHNIPDFQ